MAVQMRESLGTAGSLQITGNASAPQNERKPAPTSSMRTKHKAHPLTPDEVPPLILRWFPPLWNTLCPGNRGEARPSGSRRL